MGRRSAAYLQERQAEPRLRHPEHREDCPQVRRTVLHQHRGSDLHNEHRPARSQSGLTLKGPVKLHILHRSIESDHRDNPPGNTVDSIIRPGICLEYFIVFISMCYQRLSQHPWNINGVKSPLFRPSEPKKPLWSKMKTAETLCGFSGFYGSPEQFLSEPLWI